MCKEAGETEQRGATGRGMYKLVIPRFDPIQPPPLPQLKTIARRSLERSKQAAMDRHGTTQGELNAKNYKDCQSRNYRQIELKKY